MDRYEPVVDMTWPLRWIAQKLAVLRNKKIERFGLTTHGHVLTGQEANTIGLWAEVAVSYRFDVPIDTNIYTGGDCGTDTIILDNKIGIKATTYWDEPLLRVELDAFIEDHYYFCIAVDITNKKVRFVGWANPKMVKNAPVKQLVYGGPQNYILKQNQLCQFIPRPIDKRYN